MTTSEDEPSSFRFEKTALIWEESEGNPTSIDRVIQRRLQGDENPSKSYLSYQSIYTLSAILVRHVRKIIQKALISENYNSFKSTISAPIAVAITEGVLLPIAIAVCHALNEPFLVELGEDTVYVSAVLIPLDPSDAERRLSHMIHTSKPILILTATDCHTQKIHKVITETSKQDGLEGFSESCSSLFRPNRTTVCDLQEVCRRILETPIIDQLIKMDGKSLQTIEWNETFLRQKILQVERALFPSDPKIGDPHLQTQHGNRISHCVFTSGSSGDPKGCVSSTQSLDNYIRNKNMYHQINHTSVVLLASSVSFDPCLGDVLATWTVGATLAIARRQELSQNLSSVLQRQNVTHCLCTPSLWSSLSYLTQPVPESFPRLQVIALGGEPIPNNILRKWARPQPNHSKSGTKISEATISHRLFATYGVTEACVYQTFGEVFYHDENANETKGLRSQPVGKPFDGLEVRICHESEQDVDIRVFGPYGEVVLSGNQLDELSSYLLQPDLTKMRFVVDNTGSCCYRTGDRGFIDPTTGDLHICGRISQADGMVKVNGVRLELGEIEAAVIDDKQESDNPVVVDAIASLSGQRNPATVTNLSVAVILSHQCLVEMGLVGKVPASGVLCDSGPLLTLLRERCETRARFTPPTYIIIPTVPLTPTGKRDRPDTENQLGTIVSLNALVQCDPAGRPSVLLRNYGTLGSIVAREIVECLNLQPVQQAMITTKASFSMLGGDSLAAVRVVRALYAQNKGVHNTRFLGGEYGILEDPFKAEYLISSADLGSYVDYLESHGVCQHDNVLTQNARPVDPKERRLVLENSNPDGSHPLTLYDALLEATSLGLCHVALGLLAVGVDPNAGMHQGRLGKTSGRRDRKRIFRSSPLHFACFRGDVKLVRALLCAGAKFNSPDASGMFPIHLIAVGDSPKRDDDMDRIECIKLLLDHGAPLTMKDGSKQTVLHAAARAGRRSLVRFVIDAWLQKYGQDPRRREGLDWRDSWSRTAVHWSVLNGHVDCLAMLIRAGCSTDPFMPKCSHRTSAAMESPIQMCLRVHGQSSVGLRMLEILGSGSHETME